MPAPACVDEPGPKQEDEGVQILDALAAAYQAKDQQAARKAWLHWGEHVWPETPPSNLNRLAERSPQRVAAAVLALDKAIYSPAHEEEWVKFSPRELLEHGTIEPAYSSARQ
jgi:hypothetical protein